MAEDQVREPAPEDPTPEPAAESTPEPTPVTTPQPPADPTAEASAEPGPEPSSESAAEAVPGLPPEPDPAAESDRRPVTELRKPSTVGGVIYLFVLAGAISGVVVAATGPWRTGVSWLAFSLLAAAAARLVLPDADAGMLRVRGKILDATILVAMGVTILMLAGTIPDQPV